MSSGRSGCSLETGDRITMIIDEEAVIVNLEHGVGITAGDDIDIIDLLNDPRKNTLGGSVKSVLNFSLALFRVFVEVPRIHHDLSSW